jgi:hypothetical protein
VGLFALLALLCWLRLLMQRWGGLSLGRSVPERFQQIKQRLTSLPQQ